MTDIDIKALRAICAKAKMTAGEFEEFEPGDFPEGTRSQAEYLAAAANVLPELLNRVEFAESRSDRANEAFVRASDENAKLRAELETARALADVRGNEVARLADEHGTVKAQRDKLRRACRAALGTWCPHGNPGGDGADGETFELCESAIALEPGR